MFLSVVSHSLCIIKNVKYKIVSIYFLTYFTFIWFWETERDRAQVEARQRENETESEAGSRLWVVSTEPNTGLELKIHEIMTWAEVGHLSHWAIQDPCECMFYHQIWFCFLTVWLPVLSYLERHYLIQTDIFRSSIFFF